MGWVPQAASKKDLVRLLAQSLPQKQHQEIKNAGVGWGKLDSRMGEAGQGFPKQVHPALELGVLSSGSTSFCVVLTADGELALSTLFT